ncbi:MAG TPA: hypothetical protein VEA79_07950, partial [Phenylobacterium sp.]|nr:hypothetical protein [Phenylobacterium sp.]
MPVFAASLELALLPAGQGVMIHGAAAGSAAAIVASVGDFNGDGLGDFLIGAPFADPSGKADAGAAWLVFGLANPGAAIDLVDLAASQAVVIHGASPNGLAGWSAAGVGDINGDGKADIALGAPLAEAGGSRPGVSYVVFGGTAPGTLSLANLNGTNGFRIKGAASNDAQGYSVAAAGDLNNDGIGDLVVSAPQADPNGRDTAGAVYVVYGRTTGFGAELDLSALNGANGFRIEGARDGDGLGEAVASAGDVDGDGFDDLLIGAAGASPNGRFEAGSAYLVYGAANGPAVVDLAAPGDRVTRFEGQADRDGLGDAVAAAGDVNGDGLGDFLIGTPGADARGRVDSGAAFLVYGRAGGFGATFDLSSLDAFAGVRIDGAQAGALTGASLAATDINGDRLNDILLGAPGADISGQADTGAVFALLTNAAGFPAAVDLAGLSASSGSVIWGAAGDAAGVSLAGIGDQNGDGYGDFLIGAQAGGPADGGAAYLIYGGPAAGGGGGGVVIFGDAGANVLTGAAGGETFRGQGGDDRVYGGGGADTAAYQARAADYAWWREDDGSWRVQDLRSGSPEGLDALVDVELLQFSDRTVKIAGATTLEQLSYAFEYVLRRPAVSPADLGYLSSLASQVTSGAKTFDQAAADIAEHAEGTTAVAAMSYQFFLGYAPTKSGFDYLVSPNGPNPNNLNSAYYQFFNLENRFINFTVNLGKVGEGAAAFGAEYGGLTLSAATSKAYAEIFGLAPSAARLDAILNTTFQMGGQTLTRADYFAVYGGDGLAGIGTKAAMVGWLMAEAAKADLGVLARAANAYLTDLADSAPFRVDLMGTYAQPDWAF